MRYDLALIRNTDASKTVLEVAGSLLTQGVAAEFDTVNLPQRDTCPRVLSDYPSYAWDHCGLVTPIPRLVRGSSQFWKGSNALPPH